MIFLLGHKWLWFVSIQNSLYDVPLSFVLLPFHFIIEAISKMPNSPISTSGLNPNPQNIHIYSSGYNSAPSLISNYFSIFEMPPCAVSQKFFTRFWQFKMLMKHEMKQAL